jgi:hypothetical protein
VSEDAGIELRTFATTVLAVLALTTRLDLSGCRKDQPVCHGIYSTLRNVSPVAVLHIPDELELLQGDVEVGVLELRR